MSAFRAPAQRLRHYKRPVIYRVLPPGSQTPFARSQDDDRQIARLTLGWIEHPLDAVVLGESERIIKDHWGVPTTSRETPREGQAHEDGDMLLRAGGQHIDGLLLSIPDQGLRQRRVVGLVQLGSGPQRLQPLTGNLKDRT